MFTPRAARRAACALAFSALTNLIPPSANAAPQWEVLFASSSLDEVFDLTIAPDGSIYAAGRANADFLTLKITSTGSVVWNRVYNAGSSDFAFGVAVDPAGYVYAGGEGAGFGSAQDYVWAKYTSTGGAAGTMRHDTGVEDYVVGLEASPDGNIVMGGWDFNGNLRVIKFTPGGSIVWSTSYDSGTGDAAYRMALDRDGNVILVGRRYSTTISQTVKFSSSGTVQWARTYASTAPDEGRGVGTDQYGNVYVGGYRGYGATESGYSMTLLKYDSAGALVWSLSRQDAGDSGGNVGAAVGIQTS